MRAGARKQETQLLQEVGLGKWVGQEVQERNALAPLSSRSDLLIPPIGQAHREPEEGETQMKQTQGSAPGHSVGLRKAENGDGPGGANGE